MSTDPIRARLDALERYAGEVDILGHTHDVFDALRAVLDLADQHALCHDCDSGRYFWACVAGDLRRVIADALKVTE